MLSSYNLSAVFPSFPVILSTKSKFSLHSWVPLSGSKTNQNLAPFVDASVGLAAPDLNGVVKNVLSAVTK